ncbi:MAG: hypothetical protein HYT65_02665 [Candidatus Yanofskybacteria bacterium]|nr:hypothetical protein [Candidatus Yanofskybacteria bacterium]
MNNVWFYSLSTISQTMAGIAGFFAVFVIFKIDKINNLINSFRKIILHAIQEDGHEIVQLSDRDFVIKARVSLKNNAGITTVGSEKGRFTVNEQTLSLLEKFISNKEEVIRSMILPLTFSLISILASIFMLVWTDNLAGYSKCLLPGMFILTAFSLVYIGFTTYYISKS